MEKETCKGVTKKGERCQKKPSNGKKFCHFHAPDELVLEMTEICPICLENDENMFELSCSHKVHLECVKNVPDVFCVICRQEMTNLPARILEKIKQNEKTYKEELEEEDRRVAEMSSFQLQNLFSLYIRPPPHIEVKYALLYLKSRGIPFRYVPSKIKIVFPEGHPRPSSGVFFSAVVGHTLRKMKEDISSYESGDSSESEDSCEFGEFSELDPFQGELEVPRVFIDFLTIDPQEFEEN